MAMLRLTRPAFPVIAATGPTDMQPATPGATIEGSVASAGTVTIAASSTEPDVPSSSTIAVGYGSVVLAGAVIWYLDGSKSLPASLSLAADVNAFALIYVAAQAVERLVEPFSLFVLPTKDDKDTVKAETVTALTATSPALALEALSRAATAKAKVKLKKSERAVIFWALATVVGIAASAALGLRFLAVILAAPAAGAAPMVPAWVDVVLTGLVIGAGAKGLHDLVQKLQKPADTGDDGAE